MFSKAKEIKMGRRENVCKVASNVRAVQISHGKHTDTQTQTFAKSEIVKVVFVKQKRKLHFSEGNKAHHIKTGRKLGEMWGSFPLTTESLSLFLGWYLWTPILAFVFNTSFSIHQFFIFLDGFKEVIESILIYN